MTQDQRKWTEISIAYETEPDERTEKQKVLTHSGLCFAALELEIPTHCTELKRITGEFGLMGWWWPFYGCLSHTRQHDLYRATFAAFMAALSAKDIKEMLDNE